MKKKTAICPTRQDNYAAWYQEIIAAANLAQNSPVRGCMVIMPWGYAIWEQMQQYLDQKFKDTGHENAYFPLLIPLSNLEAEAKHIDGFAKECAVVTHHRLKFNEDGELIPDGKLEEPLIIRPTSETIIGQMYSKWIKSYRDLPILINQWANVMRWEMRTRMFLRTSEFLWQEGHTAHATSVDAKQETVLMLDVYEEFLHNVLAIPVIKGIKPSFEKFPGADTTYCVEAMMQNGMALQAGTSHFLGQNFAKSFDIKFLNEHGNLEYAWTTSWGVSTRLIGGLIMSHSDDNGLVLPPYIAPIQIIILPIYKNNHDDDILINNYCQNLELRLKNIMVFKQMLRVKIDKRNLRGGGKKWEWIKKGVPIVIEIGLQEANNNVISFMMRDSFDSAVNNNNKVDINTFLTHIEHTIVNIQNNLFNKAYANLKDRIKPIDNYNDFKQFFNNNKTQKSMVNGSDDCDEVEQNHNENNLNNGFALCFAVDDASIEQYIKPLKVTARCIDMTNNLDGCCIFTGAKTNIKMYFAKAY